MSDRSAVNDQTTAPDQDAWDAWSPAELSRQLSGVSKPWCIVGGWALELRHGMKTRQHDDIEFTVLREDIGVFQHTLSDTDFYAVRDSVLKRLLADEDPAPEISQVWCFDRVACRWRADMMIEPGTDETWVYKRELRIKRPRADMVALTADGIPYLNPSAVLLFKAKYCRPKDEQDFAYAAPRLPMAERLWLRDCLERLHPGHRWTDLLSTGLSQDHA